MTTSKTILVAVATLLAGLALGYLLFSGSSAATPEGDAAAEGEETWYTCGMHPTVLSKTPGDCPQCGMKLTPRKVGNEESGPSKDRKIAYWVAPMDPSYVRDEPGKSPMGMDLVPVYEEELSSGPSVRIQPVTEQNMGIRTAPVIRGPLVRKVRSVGNVDYDETKLGIVTLKIGGYIEKLRVDQTGVMVSKGDPLFDMYAPEVVQAQEEYLRTKANLEKATGEEERSRWRGLFEQARQKLLRWDLSEDQIRGIGERGRSTKVMTWRSPFDGIVTHKNAVEGAYIKAGDPLYRIAGLSTVWVYVSIYEYEFPWVKEGQSARMELPYFPGQTFTGEVDYIYPYLDPKTRDRKVRLNFPNPGLELLPDMYATVNIDAELAANAVLVPSEAVIDTGTRQVVFVAAGGGSFDPREVRVGVESEGGYREVVHGLRPGEVVVTSGQFLLDSESKIQEAIQKMLKGRTGKGEPTPAAMEEEGPAAAEFEAPDGLVPVVAEVCPVMGGEPTPDIYVDYDGYRVFFCCSGCPARFREDPESYMAKLERMGALPGDEGTASDPFAVPEGLVAVVPEKCPVMGGEPDPEVYVDYKGHRFFFCCPGCPDEFLADPDTYIEKLRAQGLAIHIPD